MKKVLLACALAFVATANAAIDETIRLKESIEINAPVEKVWAKMGSFADMSWHPAIEKRTSPVAKPMKLAPPVC